MTPTELIRQLSPSATAAWIELFERDPLSTIFAKWVMIWLTAARYESSEEATIALQALRAKCSEKVAFYMTINATDEQWFAEELCGLRTEALESITPQHVLAIAKAEPRLYPAAVDYCSMLIEQLKGAHIYAARAGIDTSSTQDKLEEFENARLSLSLWSKIDCDNGHYSISKTESIRPPTMRLPVSQFMFDLGQSITAIFVQLGCKDPRSVAVVNALLEALGNAMGEDYKKLFMEIMTQDPAGSSIKLSTEEADADKAVISMRRICAQKIRHELLFQLLSGEGATKKFGIELCIWLGEMATLYNDIMPIELAKQIVQLAGELRDPDATLVCKQFTSKEDAVSFIRQLQESVSESHEKKTLH